MDNTQTEYNWKEIFPKDKYFAIHGPYDDGREIMLYSYEPRTVRVIPNDLGSYLHASIYPGCNDRESVFSDMEPWSSEEALINSLSNIQVVSLWKYAKTLISVKDMPSSIWHQDRIVKSMLENKEVEVPEKPLEQQIMDEALEARDILRWQQPLARINEPFWKQTLRRIFNLGW